MKINYTESLELCFKEFKVMRNFAISTREKLKHICAGVIENNSKWKEIMRKDSFKTRPQVKPVHAAFKRHDAIALIQRLQLEITKLKDEWFTSKFSDIVLTADTLEIDKRIITTNTQKISTPPRRVAIPNETRVEGHENQLGTSILCAPTHNRELLQWMDAKEEEGEEEGFNYVFDRGLFCKQVSLDGRGHLVNPVDKKLSDYWGLHEDSLKQPFITFSIPSSSTHHNRFQTHEEAQSCRKRMIQEFDLDFAKKSHRQQRPMSSSLPKSLFSEPKSTKEIGLQTMLYSHPAKQKRLVLN